jgi:glyoxylase-like metal-dependent hydrolase (beta-lactamase superfamily II)
MRRDDIVTLTLPTAFPVGPVNAYLVRGERLTLVDAGMRTEGGWESLTGQLAAAGVAPADLELILLTHGHVDHVGYAGRLAEASGAPIGAHPIVAGQAAAPAETAEKSVRFTRAVLTEMGLPDEHLETCLAARDSFAELGLQTPVSLLLEDGARCDGFTVHHVPGHSATDTLLVDAESGIAFTGDHILKGIHPNPLIRRPRPGQPRPKSLLEYHRSLLHTRSLDLSVCFTGHGPPLEDHRAAIDANLARQERKAADIVTILAEGAITPYQLARRLFPKTRPEYLYPALSVAVGYLELIESRGVARSEHRDGVLWFSP